MLGGGQDGEDEDSLSASRDEKMPLALQDPSLDGTGFVDTSIMTQA